MPVFRHQNTSIMKTASSRMPGSGQNQNNVWYYRVVWS
jgi:hypothetical protein